MASTSQARGWSSLPTDSAVVEPPERRVGVPALALCRVALSLLPGVDHSAPANTAEVGTANIRYYSPYYDKNFEVDDTLKVPGAKICCSTGRHLKMCADKALVYDIDLVTGALY
uniref:Uncharacterized protein n=1 Tax=Oryza meridionalis TaxID=40149 RepID=A0A0E0ERT4_9ORYZ